MLVPVLLSLWVCVSSTITKIGHKAGTQIQINNVGSGLFDPDKFANWHFEARSPLIAPNNAGTCPKNIYNPSAVHNGKTGWNIYFGGWDGVSSCHDSVSVTVTEDTFASFNAHVPMIKTGSVIHVNNPSAIKVNESMWLMVTTQLQTSNLNKPAIAIGTTGIDWTPSEGGVVAGNVAMNGYAGWDQADVNGGNVLFWEESTQRLHLYFIDFKTESTHSVYHATAGPEDLRKFTFANVALAEPMKVVNDLKLVNGLHLMSLHMNSQSVWYSVSPSLDMPFPPSKLLFSHRDDADKYIVSVGWILDDSGDRVMGALYGAGAVPALDENKIFAAWLQKKVIFRNNETIWGIGDASQALGPDVVQLNTNNASLQGQFFVYDTDFVDLDHPGTLLEVSDTVTVTQGDIWAIS